MMTILQPFVSLEYRFYIGGFFIANISTNIFLLNISTIN